MVVPIMIMRGIESLGDAFLRVSEMALSGAQMYRHGGTKVTLKPVIITEVGSDPTIALMTDTELKTLLDRPEVRNGTEKYKTFRTANAVAQRAA